MTDFQEIRRHLQQAGPASVNHASQPHTAEVYFKPVPPLTPTRQPTLHNIFGAQLELCRLLHQTGAPPTRILRHILPNPPRRLQHGPTRLQQAPRSPLKYIQIGHRTRYILLSPPSRPLLTQISMLLMSKPRWHSRLSRVIQTQDPSSSETCLRNASLCSQPLWRLLRR